MGFSVLYGRAKRMGLCRRPVAGPMFGGRNTGIDLSFGINAILEGVVPWYEWWDSRYGIQLWDPTHVSTWYGRRHGSRLDTPLETAAEYGSGVGGFSLPTVRTFTSGGLAMALTSGDVFEMSPTDRPHICAYVSQKDSSGVLGGSTLTTSSGSAQVFDYVNAGNAMRSAHVLVGGTIVVQTGPGVFVEDVPHFQEIYSTDTHRVVSKNGTSIASAANTANYTATSRRLILRGNATSALDRRYAVYLLSSARIPDPQRAAIQAYCEAEFA